MLTKRLFITILNELESCIETLHEAGRDITKTEIDALQSINCCIELINTCIKYKIYLTTVIIDEAFTYVIKVEGHPLALYQSNELTKLIGFYTM